MDPRVCKSKAISVLNTLTSAPDFRTASIIASILRYERFVGAGPMQNAWNSRY